MFNFMPGDLLSETVTIINRSRDGDYIRLYLRAEPHGIGNPIIYSESCEWFYGKDQKGISGQRDETLDTMERFLSQLTLRGYDGEALIYEDSPNTPGGLQENVYLGTLRRYHSLDVQLELDVPAALGNHFSNRVGKVDWIFTAELFDDPEKPDIPKTGDVIMGSVAAMALSVILLVIMQLSKRRRK